MLCLKLGWTTFPFEDKDTRSALHIDAVVNHVFPRAFRSGTDIVKKCPFGSLGLRCALSQVLVLEEVDWQAAEKG